MSIGLHVSVGLVFSSILFRHAGVWTTEEAVRMCRDKMVRLRSLYIDQFKRLQHVLKEKRRKYLHAIQTEEENEFGKSLNSLIYLLDFH